MGSATQPALELDSYRSAMARAPCSQICRSIFLRENSFPCWAEWVRQEHGAAPAGRAGDPATRTYPAPWKAGDRPGDRPGVVFQDYSLFPWMTLTENVVLAIGKAHPQLDRKQRRELAEEYLELVGLADAHGKYPQELSGGMCQRGAIARALPWARRCC